MESLEGFAVIDLMGHKRIGGYLSEVSVAGESFVRVDIMRLDGSVYTQLYSAKAIWSITPTTEAVARSIGSQGEAPIQRWELPALEAMSPMSVPIPGDRFDDDGRDDDDDE